LHAPVRERCLASPPLQAGNERRDDIVLLAGYFCEQCRMKFGLMSVALSPAAWAITAAR
jgi:transcriptional regulator with GAF, ATPase, and Fis domain